MHCSACWRLGLVPRTAEIATGIPHREDSAVACSSVLFNDKHRLLLIRGPGRSGSPLRPDGRVCSWANTNNPNAWPRHPTPSGGPRMPKISIGLLVLLLVALTTSVTTVSGQQSPDQTADMTANQNAKQEPHMSAALGHLHEAEAELTKASPNKG